MDNKNRSSTLNNIMGIAAIFIFITLIGGALGFMSQTGIINTVGRNRRYTRRPIEKLTKAEYKQRTGTGWWVGCGVGSIVSIGILVGISRRVKLKQKPSANDPLA
jgi:Na+-transporting NADH:ubiquinone oxidoreductase subunit NqrE